MSCMCMTQLVEFQSGNHTMSCSVVDGPDMWLSTSLIIHTYRHLISQIGAIMASMNLVLACNHCKLFPTSLLHMHHTSIQLGLSTSGFIIYRSTSGDKLRPNAESYNPASSQLPILVSKLVFSMHVI